MGQALKASLQDCSFPAASLSLAGGKMYWTDYGTSRIQRANLDGTSVENLVTSGIVEPRCATRSLPKCAPEARLTASPGAKSKRSFFRDRPDVRKGSGECASSRHIGGVREPSGSCRLDRRPTRPNPCQFFQPLVPPSIAGDG
jgi:hypothetical protein